jgi:hypothetical protein
MKTMAFTVLLAFIASTLSADGVKIMIASDTVRATPETNAAFDLQRTKMQADTSYAWAALATDAECYRASKNNIDTLIDCMYNSGEMRWLEDMHSATCNERGGFARRISEMFQGAYKGKKFGLREYEKILVCVVFFERWRFENARMANAAWQRNGYLSPDMYEANSNDAFEALRKACNIMLGESRREFDMLSRLREGAYRNPWNMDAVIVYVWLNVLSGRDMTKEIDDAMIEKRADINRSKARAAKEKAAQRKADIKNRQREDRLLRSMMSQ